MSTLVTVDINITVTVNVGADDPDEAMDAAEFRINQSAMALKHALQAHGADDVVLLSVIANECEEVL